MADSDLDRIAGGGSNARDAEVERLSRRLTELQDKRQEDWFFVILAALLLLDIHVFSAFDNWGAPIAILALELILIVLAAERLGIETVSVWASYVIDKFGGRNNG